MQRLADLVERMAITQSATAGKASGVEASWAKVIAIIGAIGAVGYLIINHH